MKLIMLWTKATKEAIRVGGGGAGGEEGGVKKLILQNNDKSLETHYRLDMSHIQSYINSMHNIMILIRRRSI